MHPARRRGGSRAGGRGPGSVLRADSHHGLSVVGACLAGGTMLNAIAGVPVYSGLGSVAAAVVDLGADTLAVLACPAMNGIRLRELAWQLEATGTDVYMAPALLDMAGPRTMIRPVAGLPLLHADHRHGGCIYGSGRRCVSRLGLRAVPPVLRPSASSSLSPSTWFWHA